MKLPGNLLALMLSTSEEGTFISLRFIDQYMTDKLFFSN